MTPSLSLSHTHFLTHSFFFSYYDIEYISVLDSVLICSTAAPKVKYRHINGNRCEQHEELLSENY